MALFDGVICDALSKISKLYHRTRSLFIYLFLYASTSPKMTLTLTLENQKCQKVFMNTICVPYDVVEYTYNTKHPRNVLQ